MNKIFALFLVTMVLGCSLDKSDPPPAEAKPTPAQEQNEHTETQDFKSPFGESVPAEKPYAIRLTQENDVERMKALLESSPTRVYERDEEGRTPLHYARSREMAELLWDVETPSADFNNSELLPMSVTPDIHGALPFHEFAKRPGSSAFDFVLDRECAVLGFFSNLFQGFATSSIINAKDLAGHTPLHDAVLTGRQENVLQLLTCEQVEIDAEDLNGNTPLALALSCGQPAMSHELIQKGAQREHKNIAGQQASEMSAEPCPL